MSQLEKNVRALLDSRGLSLRELGKRVDMTPEQLSRFISGKTDLREGALKRIAEELLVPDFALLREEFEAPASALIDFRNTNPTPSEYSKATLKAIDLASTVQQAGERLSKFREKRSIEALIESERRTLAAARKLRAALKITDQQQINAKDTKNFLADIRKRIESLEAFVLQLNFPEVDGAGFCLASRRKRDVIVVNSQNQTPQRRLFTFAHEIYHCILNRSGVSDPNILRNDIERRCNEFAVEFLTPESLVSYVATNSISKRDFNIRELRRFSRLSKISLHASLLRLIETGYYRKSAVEAWEEYISEFSNPDFPKKRKGGQPQEEWKNKLAKYGYKFAEVFGEAKQSKRIDEYDLFTIAGLKPKYQDAYLSRARAATSDDVGEVEDA